MTRVRMIIGEAWRSFTASMSTTIAATMTVLVGMFVLGMTIGLGTWVLSWSNHVKKEVIVKVFFCTQETCGHEATAAQINAAKAQVASADATVVTTKQALERAKSR